MRVYVSLQAGVVSAVTPCSTSGTEEIRRSGPMGIGRSSLDGRSVEQPDTALSNRGDVAFITYGAEQHAYSWRAGVRYDLCVSFGAPSAANDAGYLAGESTFNGAGAHAFVWRDGRIAVAPAAWDTSNRLLEPMKRPWRRAATNQEGTGRTVGAGTHRRTRRGSAPGSI
jgi:hypothetical protein